MQERIRGTGAALYVIIPDAIDTQLLIAFHHVTAAVQLATNISVCSSRTADREVCMFQNSQSQLIRYFGHRNRATERSRDRALERSRDRALELSSDRVSELPSDRATDRAIKKTTV